MSYSYQLRHCVNLVAGANLAIAKVLALAAGLANVGAVVLAAETAEGREQAAADAAGVEGRPGLNIAGLNDAFNGGLHDVLVDLGLSELLLAGEGSEGRLHLVFPDLLLAINLVAAAFAGVASADSVAGAAIAGKATSAVRVAFSDTHVVASGVAAENARD
jgi:hypothetical protein